MYNLINGIKTIDFMIARYAHWKCCCCKYCLCDYQTAVKSKLFDLVVLHSDASKK